jgi:hypothetical protein
MAKSKQTHIFATRQDLVPGLTKIETEVGVRYARCGNYAGSIFEHYLSLLAWDGLGSNTSGNHVSGPQFLVVPKSEKINVEPLPGNDRSSSGRGAAQQPTVVVDDAGRFSKSTLSLDRALTLLDDGGKHDITGAYALSQKLNPDSIVFSPGGVYDKQPALIAGHIGTVSQSKSALALYKDFVKAVTAGFEKIGSYHVGPEAGRLMAQGYRMVTIGIGSPAIYDLKRT